VLAPPAAAVVVLLAQVAVLALQAPEQVVPAQALLRALRVSEAQVRVLPPVQAQEQLVPAALRALRRGLVLASRAAALPLPLSPPSFSCAMARNSASAARARCAPA
jgi:hypothetical protein